MTTSYAYDSNGNRLSRTDNTGTISGTYDDQDRLLQYGDIAYSYTANGDLTSKTQNAATVSYDYDVFGNLRHVVLDNGIAIDYVIDGRNRRIGKKVNGTLVQAFLYEDPLRPAAEFDGSGNVVARFVYGTMQNAPELILKGGATYRVLKDHVGSPHFVVDTGTGTVAQRLDYDEFGVVTLDTNPGFQPFGFAGGLYDPQTKLVRFGARDYDAQVGRWTTKDPIGLSAAPNVFEYVASDPVNRIDPTGLQLVVYPPAPPDTPVGPCCTAGPWEPCGYFVRDLGTKGDWVYWYTQIVRIPNPTGPSAEMFFCFCWWHRAGGLHLNEPVYRFCRDVPCGGSPGSGRESRSVTGPIANRRYPEIGPPETARTEGVWIAPNRTCSCSKPSY